MNDKSPFQFGIASLLLITALVAVIMGVSVMVPGIGICLAIVSVPALVRAYVVVRGRRVAGASVSNSDKALLFLACACTALLIAVATGAAFFVTCLVGFLAGMNFGGSRSMELGFGPIVGGISGTCFALPLLIYLLRKWFKHPPDRAGLLRKWFRHSPVKPATGEPLRELRGESDHSADEAPMPMTPNLDRPPSEPPPEPPPKPPAAQAEDAEP